MASKRNSEDLDEDENTSISVPGQKTKKGKWTNKQRVLVFCGRGITHRARHLMLDLRTLLPHHKTDTKLDRKDKLFIINEVCEMKSCNTCIFLEMRKKKDLFMWFSFAPHGPSAKFLVENIHTMDELKLTGNCLKGSRPVLSFDKQFDKTPENQLLKEMFNQIFSTPNYHPKSKPFTDRVMTFSILDNKRIWVRNFQIVDEGGTLLEIGTVKFWTAELDLVPTIVSLSTLTHDAVMCAGCLTTGSPTWLPVLYRRMIRRKAAFKYIDRMDAKLALETRREESKDISVDEEDVDDIFHTITQSDIDKARANKSTLKSTPKKKRKTS
ncbi:ribosome biogenesis protein BRX1 homolog [Exaiptasia diaphana]|uniref:Ribosome biogenesis protein BRX1 homolog n=1 Tax=Exaiptasia diaphana TaxID=2652724 RepID=A0A913XWL3_EXADI|nr:ribosome biogenesis protein BRX1 homolog [Exaiptasia diaphana]